MARKSKFEEEPVTKPGPGRRKEAPTVPPRVSGVAAKRPASEAPTEPPPPPSKEIAVVVPKSLKPGKVSGLRPKRGGAAATVDEVTADMTNDPRRDDDD